MAERNQSRPQQGRGKGKGRGKPRGPKRGPRKGPAKGGQRPGKSRRPKSLTPARILQKYDNLLEQHIVARRKYFEMHGRAQGRQLQKIENNFERTLNALRRFEEGLKDWQLEVLKEKIDGLPADRQYSSSRELEPKGEDIPFAGEFEDPHLTPVQREADYSDDTEESVGTIEDYKAYKGLE